MLAALCWAALKVIRLAKRSVAMHKNPAYMLYSDPACLNKWGFLYVQYRATAYYYVVPFLGYILIKAIFIAFGQSAGTVQAIGLVVIEAVWLVSASVLRPWMDKKTNIFNISIAAINFLNGIFLLVFTSVFNQPGIVTGVMGVIFFIYNAIFALILLILVLLASGYAMFSKNPDNRYQPMRDDRGSFIKSQDKLTTELDALGATARGDLKQPYPSRGLDGDKESFSSDSENPSQHNLGYQQSTAASSHAPRSPVDPGMPLFPSDASGRSAAPPTYNNGMYNNSYNNSQPDYYGQQQQAPAYGHDQAYSRTGSSHSSQQQYGGQPQQQQYAAYRQQNTASPWQRGAGYEH